MRKRGEGTPVWLVIALVLGIVVLVVLALGFSSGWGNLWTKMKELFGIGGPNLATISQACSIACNAEDETSYCLTQREVSGLKPNQVLEIKKPAGDVVTVEEIANLSANGITNSPELKAEFENSNVDKTKAVNDWIKKATFNCNELTGAGLIKITCQKTITC